MVDEIALRCFYFFCFCINCSHSSSLFNSTAYTETIMGNFGSVVSVVDDVKFCIPLNECFGGAGICLESSLVEPDKGGEAKGEGVGKICAKFTIENLGLRDDVVIVPFGANGLTKLDFENLEDVEVIAEQCVSVNQLPIAVVANPGIGFWATSFNGQANLAYADKVAFLFTEEQVAASILGEASVGGFLF